MTSFISIQQDLFSGKTSCTQLVASYLSNIEKTKHLNIYVEVFAQEAKQQALLLDEKYAENPKEVGRLFGLVISIKDVLCYKDHEVTAASKILKGFQSLFTATAIQRLLDEDAIIIGRVNCDEFAMGSTNENSIYGAVRNAANSSKVPGGSSGGSAVAVQADTCLVSLGSDTGGSVRQPAAFCGVMGMKPTYGRISRYGLLAYASSFDQIGILSKSVENIAIVLEIMAGHDEQDSTSSQEPVENYSAGLSFFGKKRGEGNPKKIAYFETALQHKSIDSEIREQTFGFIQKLKARGHIVDSVDFEYLDYIIPAYYVLTTAEASSNLSRFDGVRYGHRAENTKDLMEVYKKSRSEGFGAEVKRRIMLGTFVLSSGYYDAYYTKAQKIRRLIADKTFDIFEKYDFILMPASPTPPWNIGEKKDDPVEVYLADIFTVQANMVGIPAISLPLGKHKNGLPMGIQLMANKFEEQQLLAFSHHLTTSQ
ncbi:MAG TPA: Asp-tRNA(Asn)/Glu-tRNA(Gln) amidotransferase subunit GatA [Phaeodactylibacter sp.]|nr:Asp-tRNA(Asn)/Glu-tRNA(Gln) amidotransferase subunit GatA [Phaeodactylibacter sp.]